jgi:SOS-response transcriptional repressor LexA
VESRKAGRSLIVTTNTEERWHMDWDIPGAVGIKSSSTAVQHLLKVQNAGLVEWEQGKSRTIRLTEAGRREIE